MQLNELQAYFSNPENELSTKTKYAKAMYTVVSIAAYLSGVRKSIFENENEGPRLHIYEELEKNRDAKILRSLCMLRNAMELYYAQIFQKFNNEFRNIQNIPEYIPTEAIDYLTQQGIQIWRSRPQIDRYLMDINQEISNRVNRCQPLMPEWLNWTYIRKMLIMPKGTTEQGVKQEGMRYKEELSKYPYQVYLNWNSPDNGNIFYNDEKFVTLLYEENHDSFTELELVRDLSEDRTRALNAFFGQTDRVLVVVDCENADAVKLAAFIQSLSAEMRQKIEKVMLFDSDYTTSIWNLLPGRVDVPVEKIKTKRLYEGKSLVDMQLTAYTTKEAYKNGLDSVILVSSDSDFWAMMQALEDIRFFVLMEKEKSGRIITNMLKSKHIEYCYIDDFCTNISHSIKTEAIVVALKEYLEKKVSFNAKDMMEEIYHSTWILLSEKEQKRFYDRYVKTMKLAVSSDGEVSIKLEE